MFGARTGALSAFALSPHGVGTTVFSWRLFLHCRPHMFLESLTAFLISLMLFWCCCTVH